MSEPYQLSHDEIASYIHRCVMKLRGLWNDAKVNRSGLRATFRRWHPTIENQDPSMEMRSAIWSHIGLPRHAPAQGDTSEPRDPTRKELEAIDHAAVVTAVVAIAGDHQGPTRSFGSALQECGLSDLRLMRLLTAPSWGRLEAVLRAARRLNTADISIAWTKSEIRRVQDFLFGNDYQSRRAVTEWASDFFRARGLAPTDADNESDGTPATTSETVTTN